MKLKRFHITCIQNRKFKGKKISIIPSIRSFLRLLDRERQREEAIFFMSKMSERKPAKVLTVQMDLTENSSTRPIDRSITHPAKRAPIDKKKHEKMLLTADWEMLNRKREREKINLTNKNGDLFISIRTRVGGRKEFHPTEFDRLAYLTRSWCHVNF